MAKSCAGGSCPNTGGYCPSDGSLAGCSRVSSAVAHNSRSSGNAMVTCTHCLGSKLIICSICGGSGKMPMLTARRNAPGHRHL